MVTFVCSVLLLLMLPLQYSVLVPLTDSLPEEDLETAVAPVLVTAACQEGLLGHVCHSLPNWPKRALFASLWGFLQLMPMYCEK